MIVPSSVFDGCYRAHFAEEPQPSDDGIYCPDKRAFYVERPERSAREHAEESLLRMEVVAGLPQGALPLVELAQPAGWRAEHPERGGVDVYELDAEDGDVALFCTWDERDDGWCKTLALLLLAEGKRGFVARTRGRPAASDLVLDRMRWGRQCGQGNLQACEVLKASCQTKTPSDGCPSLHEEERRGSL